MLQMLLKEMSYFSYKSLIFSLSLFSHTAAVAVSVMSLWFDPSSSTRLFLFVLISHLTVMKGKQAFLITVPSCCDVLL